jgi:hypothetical protein
MVPFTRSADKKDESHPNTYEGQMEDPFVWFTACTWH